MFKLVRTLLEFRKEAALLSRVWKRLKGHGWDTESFLALSHEDQSKLVDPIVTDLKFADLVKKLNRTPDLD